MKENKKKIYFVIGPTSSGKTDIAIDIVKDLGFDEVSDEWRGEIVGADSRQVFYDFDLTTGKATEDELNLPQGKVLHHMINCVVPGTYFSVVDFKNMALPIIDDIYKKGKVPVICGGTGQFVDAIYFEANVPEVMPDENFRKEMQNKSEEELYKMLLEKDERRASKIDQYNKVRLIRALEIINKLGIVPEQEIKKRYDESEYEVHIVNTSRKYDRHTLRDRVEARFRNRLAQGMIEEVRLAKNKYDLSGEYLEKLGLEFRYISQYLDGKISYELMVELLVYETRKYARRQETYFRKLRST